MGTGRKMMRNDMAPLGWWLVRTRGRVESLYVAIKIFLGMFSFDTRTITSCGSIFLAICWMIPLFADMSCLKIGMALALFAWRIPCGEALVIQISKVCSIFTFICVASIGPLILCSIELASS